MSGSLDLLKKHDFGGLMNTSALQFFYPFLISSDLDRKYSTILRQFMTVQYLSQMKISNALHVTTNLVNSASANRDGSNPAERLNDKYGKDDPSAEHYPPIDKFESQQQIDKFRQMLKDIVASEPKYKDLNPTISTLTMESLLTIPIIVGSKSFKVSADVLYWILFAAAGQHIKLDNPNGLSMVDTVLRHIPKDQFDNLLDPSLKERAISAKSAEDASHARALDKVGSSPQRYFASLHDKLGKAVSLFSVALKEDSWNSEVGINSSYDTAISAASISTLGANQTIVTNSSALFASMSSNYVMHLFQSLLNTIVSNQEVDVAKLISDTGSLLISNNKSLSNSVLLGIMARIQSNNVSSSDTLFSKLEQSCKANSKINVSDILGKLGVLTFEASSSGVDLSKFAEGLVEVNGQLTPLTAMVEGFIHDAASGFPVQNTTGSDITVDGVLKQYRKSTYDLIISTFRIPGIYNSVRDKLESARFNFLTKNGDATAFIETMASSLTEIIQFLTVYSFYSYFCEYTGELAAEVEVKRQDVMDFPNYCLVVPAEAMNAIYAALAANNFKEMLKDPSKFDNDFQKISTQNMNNVIKVLSNRLGVRNLIVVDEKAKQIYYKWMYSKQPQRINISTLTSYIKTQSEFIKAY